MLRQKHLSIERWVRDKGSKTVRNYLSSMVQFNRKTTMDPDQFLAWAKAQQDPLDVTDLIIKTGEELTESMRFHHTIALRSFLTHNGFRSLARQRMGYTPQEFHRGLRKQEVEKLLGYLDFKLHKLFLYASIEAGLRARTTLAIEYHHIKEDFEAGVIPCAIRFEPKFYRGKKAAGYTCLNVRSVAMLKECIKDGLVKTQPGSRIIPLAYSTIFEVLTRAQKKAGLDETVKGEGFNIRKLQPAHSLRKYFEACLDKADLDEDRKHIIEGHFQGTRAKSYTDREWDLVREDLRKAFPFIDPHTGSPELVQSVNDQLQAKDTEILRLRQQVEVLQRTVGVQDDKTFTIQSPAVNLTEQVEDLRKAVDWIKSKMKTKPKH